MKYLYRSSLALFLLFTCVALFNACSKDDDPQPGAGLQSTTLLFPKNNSKNTDTTLNLSWSAVEGAASYKLEVSTSKDFDKMVVQEENISDTAFKVNGLDFQTTYYWRVMAENGAASGPWSSTHSWTTGKESLKAPILVSPGGDDSKNTATTLILSWTKVKKAASYKLEVSTSKNFDKIVIRKESISDTSFKVKDLDYSTTYYWRVMAKNGDVLSPWSSTHSWNTKNKPLKAPTLVSPADNKTGVRILTFKWNKVKGAKFYVLQIAKSKNHTSIVVNKSKISDTSYSLKQSLTLKKTYYWRVKAIKEDVESPWSSTYSFKYYNGFYLMKNGVTVGCPAAPFGSSGKVNGVTYTKRRKSDITAANASTTCTSGITDMSSLFIGDHNFDADLSTWDVSNVTEMSEMFQWASKFTSDLSSWDVSKVTNMSRMFYMATNFNSDLNNWDVSNVTDMSWMFIQASKFTSDLSNWDVSNVTNMHDMFRQASKFTSDLSNWDVSKVTNMAQMFHRATNFNSDLNNWDVSHVTDMNHMFNNATSFNSDLSNWDVSKVTNMYSMFRRASKFTSDLSSWDVSKVTNMGKMFGWASKFTSDLSNWDVSNVTDMDFMFNNATSFNSDLSGWCVKNISTKPGFFDHNTPSWTKPKPVWGTCPGN